MREEEGGCRRKEEGRKWTCCSARADARASFSSDAICPTRETSELRPSST
jgi:hypothetical protein